MPLQVPYLGQPLFGLLAEQSEAHRLLVSEVDWRGLPAQST
jgi:hypothetical protein